MSVEAIPNRGMKFADMCLGVRTRCLLWARSHDWGERARYDDDYRMQGLISWEHDGTSWSENAAFAETLGGLRDWAGY